MQLHKQVAMRGVSTIRTFNLGRLDSSSACKPNYFFSISEETITLITSWKHKCKHVAELLALIPTAWAIANDGHGHAIQSSSQFLILAGSVGSIKSNAGPLS